MKKSFNRKFLLLPLLLLATGSAWAGWEEVGESSTETTFYIDRATIRKDGNLRRMWSLTDLKQRDKNGEMSRRSKSEYDCKGERMRYLALSTHSESMAGGKTLLNEGEEEMWRAIPPGTAAEAILEMACAQ